MPVELKSVLLRIRPSPGKCLTVASTPPSSIPSMNAVDAFSTVAGSDPYCRPHLPMGSLARPMSAGTVSVTGARLTLTPVALSSFAHPAAALVRADDDICACSLADGGRVKPDPRSWWTSPPSWSAAIISPMSPVASSATRPWRCSEVLVTFSAPSQPPR